MVLRKPTNADNIMKFCLQAIWDIVELRLKEAVKISSFCMSGSSRNQWNRKYLYDKPQ